MCFKFKFSNKSLKNELIDCMFVNLTRLLVHRINFVANNLAGK